MRPSSLVQPGIAACWLFLSLFSAPDAEAAPSSRRYTRSASQHVCEARLMPGRAKAQVARANRRPARFFVRTPRLLHHPVTVGLERSRTNPLRGHDSAALQYNTALVSGADDRLLASLEPLGVLAAPQCPVTIGGAVARRSPRGPPPPPGLA